MRNEYSSQSRAYTQYGRSSQQPPVPAPRSAHQSHIGWIITVTVLVGLLLLYASAVLAFNHAYGSIPVTRQPVRVPTNTPTPNGIKPIFAPVLGGTVSDFAQQYGPSMAPVDTTAGLWQQVTVAGQQVTLMMSTAPIKYSQDGHPHIYVLSVQAPSGVTWDSSTQQSIMAVFLPADAKFQREQPIDNGYEQIYTSAQLAATFTEGLFTNDAITQTVAPGTLYVGCNLGTAPAQAGGVANNCTIRVGVSS